MKYCKRRHDITSRFYFVSGYMIPGANRIICQCTIPDSNKFAISHMLTRVKNRKRRLRDEGKMVYMNIVWQGINDL
jgi:hypothetical protein